jgi:hypothetical protein
MVEVVEEDFHQLKVAVVKYFDFIAFDLQQVN